MSQAVVTVSHYANISMHNAGILKVVKNIIFR